MSEPIEPERSPLAGKFLQCFALIVGTNIAYILLWNLAAVTDPQHPYLLNPHVQSLWMAVNVTLPYVTVMGLARVLRGRGANWVAITLSYAVIVGVSFLFIEHALPEMLPGG